MLDALCAVCSPIEISFLWRPMLRDADDEMVLEVAANGRADRLLTFNERDFAGGERLGVMEKGITADGEALSVGPEPRPLKWGR